MKKIRLIEQVLCEYGKPIQRKAKDLKKHIRADAREKAQKAFAEFQTDEESIVKMQEHPASRIYNLCGQNCFYRFKGANFVHCHKAKDGRITVY